MAQQTAVEWLVQWSKENPVAFQSDYYAAIKQAKQMEKEQIMKAYKAHHDLGHIYGLDSEQYYKETYKK